MMCDKHITLPILYETIVETDIALINVVDELLLSGLQNINTSLVFAICGNMDLFSGFIPTLNLNNTSFGLLQWNGKRLKELITFCKNTNVPYSTVDGQIKFLVNDLRTKYENVYNEMLYNKNDIYKMARIFCLKYVNPLNKDEYYPFINCHVFKIIEKYNRVKTQSL